MKQVILKNAQFKYPWGEDKDVYEGILDGEKEPRLVTVTKREDRFFKVFYKQNGTPEPEVEIILR